MEQYIKKIQHYNTRLTIVTQDIKDLESLTMRINYEDFKNLSDLNQWLTENESITIINAETITSVNGVCYRLWFSGEIHYQ